MAAATLELAASDGFTATMNYDDVTLLSSSIFLDASNGNSGEQCTFFINISGNQQQKVSVNRGISATLTFSPAIQLTKNAKGNLVIPNLLRYGIGVGAGIGS